MSDSITLLAATASGIANVVMVAVLAVLVVIVVRQRRRLRDQQEAAIAHALTVGDEMSDLMADNDRLQAENTVIRRENNDLRDQIDRLNTMAIREAS